MQLNEIKEVFLAVTENCYHYHAKSQPDTYLVWAEDGQAGADYSDNKMKIQVIEGTVDLYTRTEYDPLFDKVQEAMNNCEEMTWRWNSTQYEEVTGYIHHEWTWQVGDAIG